MEFVKRVLGNLWQLQKYRELTHNKGENLTQSGRERGVQRLMSINLLKRLESSVHSFQLTLTRIKELINGTIQSINQFEQYGQTNLAMYDLSNADFDLDDENSDFLTVGKKVKIDLADMDWKSWRTELQKDADTLELMTLMVGDITPEHDTKLQELFKLISQKIEHPINGDNKKILIFSAFSDTAEYLYDNVSAFIMKKYGLNAAVITGSIDGRTTIKGFPATLNNVLTCFSPISKGRDVLMPGSTTDIDILIATDCISEGQNLQDCDYLVNYDIHWNPVRIIQRFGRIDRIGSRNQCIQLVNFWPDLTLDDYINLKSRVETRMKITVTFAMYQSNPEEFITKVTRLIKEQKATMIVEHITYDTIEGSYDSSIFTAEKHGLTMDKAYPAKKAIQDYVFTDGSAEKSVERKFAESLDGADEVFIYAKLPRGFFIPTPVGHYSPDWAIVFHEGAVKHIYFVAETKGTMESLNLRPIEKSKIDCAKKLFAKLSDGLVTYDHVSNYQELLNKVLK